MKRLLFIMLLFKASVCLGFKGKILNESNEAVIGATVSVYTKDSILQTNCITDTLGIYNLTHVHFPAIIAFRHIVYDETWINIDEEPKDIIITVLKEKSNILSEVTVDKTL